MVIFRSSHKIEYSERTDNVNSLERNRTAGKKILIQQPSRNDVLLAKK